MHKRSSNLDDIKSLSLIINLFIMQAMQQELKEAFRLYDKEGRLTAFFMTMFVVYQ